MTRYKGYNEKSKEATMRYMKNKREWLTMNFPVGTKEVYKQYAKSKGKSITQMFTEIMEQAMKNDGFLK